jgi:riboflavin kinase/FMN adenylyltransferase
MRIFRKLEELSPALFNAPAVTIGVFDGMHVGHRAILAALNRWAKDLRGESVVITFDRHPQSLLSDNPPPVITSLDFRLNFFEKDGIGAAVVLPFTREIAELPADAFVQKILGDHLGVRAVLLGFDTRYGKDQKGDFNHLALMAEIMGFSVRRLEVIKIGGERVSSTLVRRLITNGEIEKAEQFLGRRIVLEGEVVTGFDRGKSLGFPTANLKLHHDVRPPAGVYGGRAFVGGFDGKPYDALVSIGRHPTFGAHLPEDLVEVLLLGFDGDLVGQKLCAEIHFHLREQRAFPDKDALVKQISLDVEDARKRFSGATGEPGDIFDKNQLKTHPKGI